MEDEDAAGPIVTATEISRLMKEWGKKTQSELNRLIYPGGREAYMRVFERKFGLYPHE